jgi:4-amino-4-deoxy-L-arabinose transferase-like glycosyltransferase
MLLILLLAAGLRIGAAVAWHNKATAENQFFRLGDSHGYWTLASQIARGEPYQYASPNASIFRAPMLPILLSPFTQIDDNSRAVLSARLVAGTLFGLSVVVLVALLANRLAGRNAALVAAAMVAVYPSAIGMSIILLSELLFIPLMLGYLLLWHAAWKAPNFKLRLTWAIVTGLIGGVAILTRPSWLLFLPMVAVLGLLFSSDRKTHLQIVVAIGVGTCLVMAPWWFRNYVVTGKFVLTTLQVGPSLLDSFHEGASGGSDEGMEFMRQIEREQTEEDLRNSAAVGDPPESTFEWRINRRAQATAVAWSLEHPTQVAKLAWAKLCKTWSLWPDGGEVGSTTIRLAVSAGSFFVLLLAIAGSIPLWSTNRLLLAICWSPCLYFTLLHMVFVGSVRYREPAMIALIAVAACALARLICRPSNSLQELSRVPSAMPDRTTG